MSSFKNLHTQLADAILTVPDVAALAGVTDPQEGDIRYVEDIGALYTYNGSSWSAADTGVVGPVSTTDNALPRWDGTDGTSLSNSGVVIDDTDNITGAASLSLAGFTGSWIGAPILAVGGAVEAQSEEFAVQAVADPSVSPYATFYLESNTDDSFAEFGHNLSVGASQMYGVAYFSNTRKSLLTLDASAASSSIELESGSLELIATTGDTTVHLATDGNESFVVKNNSGSDILRIRGWGDAILSSGLWLGFVGSNNYFNAGTLSLQSNQGPNTPFFQVRHNNSSGAIRILSDSSLLLQETAYNVGIGTTNPVSKLSVGTASPFQVNDAGNILRINNIPTSFPATQGDANSVLTNDGAGNLSWGPNLVVYSADMTWSTSGAVVIPSLVARARRVGDSVVLTWGSATALGNSTSSSIVIDTTELPTWAYPEIDQYTPVFVTDDGNTLTEVGVMLITSAGVITVYKSYPGSSFTASANVVGFEMGSVTYIGAAL